jgi:hypothetical protein
LEGNVTIYFKEIGYEDVNLTYLTQDLNRWWALVKRVMKFRINVELHCLRLLKYVFVIAVLSQLYMRS